MESDTAHASRIVQDAKLRHPDLPLVEIFLINAANPNHAASYLLRVCADDVEGIKFSQFVDDWKCLVNKCKFIVFIMKKRKLKCR